VLLVPRPYTHRGVLAAAERESEDSDEWRCGLRYMDLEGCHGFRRRGKHEFRDLVGACTGSFWAGGQIELPMAASVFPHEIFCPPKAWAEALWPNLFYWNEVDRGGHFAAFEQPKLFTEELRKAFRSRRG
jgi:pimeloyl-ACP methyl ester carboxylesterase